MELRFFFFKFYVGFGVFYFFVGVGIGDEGGCCVGWVGVEGERGEVNIF